MYITRGSVWWWKCGDADRNHIQQGIRPVVVVSNDVCNQASGVITVVPMTTKVKRPFPQQVPIIMNENVSIALADQITSIPVEELSSHICNLKDFQMDQIDKAIAIQLGFIKVESRPYHPFLKDEEVTVDGISEGQKFFG